MEILSFLEVVGRITVLIASLGTIVFFWALWRADRKRSSETMEKMIKICRINQQEGIRYRMWFKMIQTTVNKMSKDGAVIDLPGVELPHEGETIF